MRTGRGSAAALSAAARAITLSGAARGVAALSGTAGAEDDSDSSARRDANMGLLASTPRPGGGNHAPTDSRKPGPLAHPDTEGGLLQRRQTNRSVAPPVAACAIGPGGTLLVNNSGVRETRLSTIRPGWSIPRGIVACFGLIKGLWDITPWLSAPCGLRVASERVDDPEVDGRMRFRVPLRFFEDVVVRAIHARVAPHEKARGQAQLGRERELAERLRGPGPGAVA